MKWGNFCCKFKQIPALDFQFGEDLRYFGSLIGKNRKMALPFDFQGPKGQDFGFDLDSCKKWKVKEGFGYLSDEKSSVLDSISSPVSSSLGSGGSGAATETPSEKCGVYGGMEDWDSYVFSDLPTGMFSGERSMMPYIMGEIDDPSVGFSKLLDNSGFLQEFDVSGGFGGLCENVDLGSICGNLDANMNESTISVFDSSINDGEIGNVIFPSILNNWMPISHIHPQQYQNYQDEKKPACEWEEKPQIFNQQATTMINHHQAQPTQNPTLHLPLTFNQQEDDQQPVQRKLKRPNTRIYEPYNQVPLFPNHSQMIHHQHMPSMPIAPVLKPKFASEEVTHLLFKAVEMIEIGNLVLAQEILARLNHRHLSPIGKPSHRASFYIKESLNSLLHMNKRDGDSVKVSPFSVVCKIGTYKLFSEISPAVQFANFTCNQAILEALDGFGQIHIIDFDIGSGFGAQWTSLIQELALRNGGPPSLKITAFSSPSSHDELEIELTLTRDYLMDFAREVNVPLQLEILDIGSFNSMPFRVSKSEAIAVSLPVGAFSNCPNSLHSVLHLLKQMSPKIVVSSSRPCDQSDLPFAHHTIEALQYYSTLLESVERVNLHSDSLEKIEKYLIQPSIEKILLGRYRFPEKTLPWKTLFLSSGFSPLSFSNFTEAQGDTIVQKTPVQGFHIEKKQSSLVLCWQQNDLVSVSAWR